MISALFCLLLGQGALSYEHRITTVSELITFSNNVNSGISYSGTTMFLGADIDFSGGLSEQFEPIGNSSSKSFQGTFDGQGHTISNLAMNSSSQYVGLFGYSSGGAIIRNVVLDSSCSVVSSYNGSSNARVAGITGQCSGCTIENTVNMASVSFTGNTTNSLFLGGIAGCLSVSSKDITMRNCINYGSVTHSGTANYARIGGIAGYSSGWYSPNKVFIQNCLNYGTIDNSGTTGDLNIGGILGYSSGTNIENCVSAGKSLQAKQAKVILEVLLGILTLKQQFSHTFTGQVMLGITMFLEE